MRLFNFIKKQPQTNSTPEQAFRHILNSMPQDYKSRKPFINSLRYIELKEWEFAVDSLIELTNETKDYFPANFWKELANFSDKMKLTEQANYLHERSKK